MDNCQTSLKMFVLVGFLSTLFLLIFGEPIVEVENGKIEGFRIGLSDGSETDIFLGVPFAEPPVGRLRYQKPQKPSKISGVLKAHKYGPGCVPSFDRYPQVPFNDDCLTLNIMKPSRPSEDELGYPVLVWIHGGGFMTGSASLYNYTTLSEFYVKQGIIIVTVQYRMGFLGFSSSGDGEIPANLGLWDNAAALRYLYENINQFGGNPHRITVWGLSSSSASVGALTLSPHSRDYIAQGIEMSGSVMGIMGHGDVPERTKEFAEVNGCPRGDTKKMRECLEQKDAKVMMENLAKGMQNGKIQGGFGTFCPMIDGDFFPHDYPRLIKEAPKKPILTGITDKEGGFMTLQCDMTTPMMILKDQWTSYGLENCSNFITNYAKMRFPAEHQKAEKFADALVDFYLKKNAPENPDYIFYLEKYTDFNSDIIFSASHIWEMILRAGSGWPTFFYYNSYFNEGQFQEGIPVKGAYHTQEYIYTLGRNAIGDFEFNNNDRKVQNFWLEAIGNFVKYGNPSTKTQEWPPMSKFSPHRSLWFKSDSSVEIVPEIIPETIEFWKKMIKEFGEKALRNPFEEETGRKIHEEL